MAFQDSEILRYKPTYIIGHGGHSKVIANILELNGVKISGYYDDDNDRSIINHIGTIEDLIKSPKPGVYICGIGDNHIRSKIVSQLSNLQWINAIHPSAIIAKDVPIGVGCVICPGAIIQPGSKIGDHVIINSNAVVEHDCSIGNFSHIAPGSTLCGNITIGERVLLGAGSTVIPKKNIGHNVIVGAGTTVIRDIPSNVKVVGSPARII